MALHNEILHNDSRGQFLVGMVAVVIMAGCALNYLVFLCSSHNSALTTSIVGTAKSVVQTAVGVFTFGGLSVSVNITVNMSACSLLGDCRLVSICRRVHFWRAVG